MVAGISLSPSSSMSSSLKPNPKACGMLFAAVLMQSSGMFGFSDAVHSRLVTSTRLSHLHHLESEPTIAKE